MWKAQAGFWDWALIAPKVPWSCCKLVYRTVSRAAKSWKFHLLQKTIECWFGRVTTDKKSLLPCLVQIIVSVQLYFCLNKCGHWDWKSICHKLLKPTSTACSSNVSTTIWLTPSAIWRSRMLRNLCIAFAFPRASTPSCISTCMHFSVDMPCTSLCKLA